MQIPLVSGIYADASPALRTSYPVNFYVVPKSSGISTSFLRPASGLVEHGNGASGVDRGGISWSGKHYRVMGSKLVEIDNSGVIKELGEVGDDQKPVTLDYSFNRLGIRSAKKLFYWDGTTLSQVTDSDLGDVHDLLWVDGYWMTTDGEFLVVTELTDPTQVDPLKYGSSEADPDPILALRKIRNEVYALNRHTIEVFDNVGGSLFPFARVEGAQVEKGTLGRDCACVFEEALAFIGGGRNEQISIYRAFNGRAEKLSTHEIDLVLGNYTEAQLSSAVLEARNDGGHSFLYVHLPDQCLLYNGRASQFLNQPIWTVLKSEGAGQYKARFFVRVYDKWVGGDPTQARLGELVDDKSSHYGVDVPWEFTTQVLYNEGRGVIVHDLELVSLTGSVAGQAHISTSYSLDGMSYSTPKPINIGTFAERGKRLIWHGLGYMRNWRTQKFQGNSKAHLSFVRLQARLEALAS